jgi:hypothetical protein
LQILRNLFSLYIWAQFYRLFLQNYLQNHPSIVSIVFAPLFMSPLAPVEFLLPSCVYFGSRWGLWSPISALFR